jgi:antitoxin (DNA-binding transcriptional repressor) of toxin-antitoxin stability system
MATVVNMLDAKTNLSKLVDSLERGQEEEFVIARNGRPAARLVPLNQGSSQQSAAQISARRIGIAKGRFEVPDDIDADNDRILHLFTGG